MKAPALGLKEVLLALVCLGLVVLAVVVSGAAPAEALQRFVQGSVVGPASWRRTLQEATPLLIAGAAVFLALRAGLFNIGADGQLVVGAMVGAAVVLALPGPVGVGLGVVLAMVAGALWALPAGLIKAYRGGHEVISTIMLNNLAGFLALWAVKGPLKDPRQQTATTALLPSGSTLPDLVAAPPFRLNLALLVAVVVVLALAWWLSRTVAGYELSAVGQNPTAAATAGVETRAVTVRAMAASGALAGLAGACVVFAYERRFYADFSPGYGFDALGVALLAGSSTLALLPSALLFAILATGTTAVQLLGVPRGLSGVLLGALIVAFAVVRYRRRSP